MRGVDDGRDKQGTRAYGFGRLISVALSSTRFQFANEATRVEITNAAAAVGEDGWAQIAPFGDFPGQMTVIGANGRPESSPRDAIQRMDRVAAEAMVANFRKPLARVVRFLRGLPIFAGHPDMPGMEARYPDKAQKGIIADLAVRDDGLYARPVFNNEGHALIERTIGQGLGFSARWAAEPAGEDRGVPIFRPTELISAGLTLTPNLPVQAINEMNLAELITALARMGIKVAADADLPTIIAAINAGADAASAAQTAAETQSANDRTALAAANGRVTALQADLVNERNARAGLLIDQAVREGRVPEADRARHLTEFANDFATAERALAAIKPGAVLPTQSRQMPAAARTASITERQQLVQQCVNERMKNGETYDVAFAAVRKSNPDLFGESAKA